MTILLHLIVTSTKFWPKKKVTTTTTRGDGGLSKMCDHKKRAGLYAVWIGVVFLSYYASFVCHIVFILYSSEWMRKEKRRGVEHGVRASTIETPRRGNVWRRWHPPSRPKYLIYSLDVFVQIKSGPFFFFFCLSFCYVPFYFLLLICWLMFARFLSERTLNSNPKGGSDRMIAISIVPLHHRN